MPRKKRIGHPVRNTGRLMLPVFLIALVFVSLGGAFYFIFLHQPQPSPAVSIQAPPPAPIQEPALLPPLNAIPPEPETPSIQSIPPAQQAPQPPPLMETASRVVIVIDDLGYHQDLDAQFLALDLDLSFSFLPFGPHTPVMAEAARRLGRDILLHLPMEAIDSRWDPGPGAIYQEMPPEEIRLALEKDLAAVPMAAGINNHMGSRFTENRRGMEVVLSFCRSRGLFFLDSLTTPRSIAVQTAADLGVPALRRDIFLDNVQEKDAVKRQLSALVALARKQGTAIGIAHPHPATLAALTEFLPFLKSAVRVVGVRELLKREAGSAPELAELLGCTLI